MHILERMIKRRKPVIALAALAALVFLALAACGASEPAAVPTPRPTLVVEIPTAEGCSSTGENSCDPEELVRRPSGGVLETPPADFDLPDFSLPAAGGGTVTLSDYLGEQPVNVVFYRGFF